MTPRSLLHLLSVVLILVTSQGMASVRGASAATGQMVICTGTGPMVVYTDAEGQPTSAPHLCPDAAMHAVGDGPLGHVHLATRISWASMPRTTAPFVLISLPTPRPPARAPPISV